MTCQFTRPERGAAPAPGLRCWLFTISTARSPASTCLPPLYLAERQDRRLLNMKLFEAYKGVSRDRLWELGEEYCDRVLMRHLYPRAIEMLEANRAAGIELVLVTGSP